MKDYHNLYSLCDVLLLADIFENFRNICMNHYGLDPAWYDSASGLAWDSALKIIKDSKFISYLDANNLYGWVMSKTTSNI